MSAKRRKQRPAGSPTPAAPAGSAVSGRSGGAVQARAAAPGGMGRAGSARERRRPTAGARRRRVGGRAVRWGMLVGGAALVLLGARALPGVASAGEAVARVGARAPALKVKSLDGEKLSLPALRGKVVLVNFWATWCPPCRAEMPGFEQVWRERQRDGFVVLGLSADEGGAGVVSAFLGEQGITYPVAMASASAKRAFGGINTLPASFLIDKRGVVRRTVVGAFDEARLRRDVSRLLGER